MQCSVEQSEIAQNTRMPSHNSRTRTHSLSVILTYTNTQSDNGVFVHENHRGHSKEQHLSLSVHTLTLSMYLNGNTLTCLSICPVFLSIIRSVFTCLSVPMPIYLSVYPSICLCLLLPACLSICPSNCQNICPYSFVSIHLTL